MQRAQTGRAKIVQNFVKGGGENYMTLGSFDGRTIAASEINMTSRSLRTARRCNGNTSCLYLWSFCEFLTRPVGQEENARLGIIGMSYSDDDQSTESK